MTYTIESAAAALAAGETTIQSIAQETGWPIIEECLVPAPNKWIAADQSGYRVEFEAESGREAAQQYVDGGDWGDDEKTQWITVSAWRSGIDEDGDFCSVSEGRHKITLEPTEPECTSEEHDWQSPLKLVGGIKENPGVYGHGGGVTIHEVCLLCGCGRVKDTWAQDQSDGEQGLRSIEYRPREFSRQIKEASAI